MQVKKAGGKVYGAVLTAAEKKAMDLEIQRELAEYDRKHIAEIDATILWVLHEQFGFGAQRLRTYYDAFHDRIKELVSRYEMEDQDDIWLCMIFDICALSDFEIEGRIVLVDKRSGKVWR